MPAGQEMTETKTRQVLIAASMVCLLDKFPPTEHGGIGRQATTRSTIHKRLAAASSLFDCKYREYSACRGQGFEQLALHILVLPLLGAIAWSCECKLQFAVGEGAPQEQLQWGVLAINVHLLLMRP